MTAAAPHSAFTVPPHVPPDRVVDVDIYRMPDADTDAHAGWKRLQDCAAHSLLWTPRNGGHWIVTRGRDIAAVYADHERFSSRITIVPREWGEQFPLRPTTLDPPEHRFYRRFLTTALSPAVVRASVPVVSQLAAAAVEALRAHGECDAVADYAARIPLFLFLQLADLPFEDAAILPRYAEDPSEDPTAPPVMQRYADYLRARLVARQQRPGVDLLSVLLTTTVDGRRLTVDEAVDVAVALMTGGIDTVISQLGFLLIFLARHPEHRRQLTRDPGQLRPAVSELLRRFPIMTKARILRVDHHLDGADIKAGEMIVLPPLHGLDDHEFSEPLTVDFDRAPASHSAFGNGVHRCPGGSLASMEIEIALREWLTRIPDFEIDPDRPPVMRGGILSAVLSAGLRWDCKTTRSMPSSPAGARQ